MTLIINNIFDQFHPVNVGILSLTLVGGVIATAWITFNNPTHVLLIRNCLINNSLNNIKANVFSQLNNPWPSILLPIFIICISFNIISLIPYTFSQTSHLSFTFSLSLPIWLTLTTMGLINNWKNKISHLVPQGTPSVLVPLMILIELVSLCIQPLTLGFRLGANILAGHLLIFLCSCVVWNAINASAIGILTFSLLFILFILEIAVACIQAAVFTILAGQYLSENN